MEKLSVSRNVVNRDNGLLHSLPHERMIKKEVGSSSWVKWAIMEHSLRRNERVVKLAESLSIAYLVYFILSPMQITL